MKISMKGLLFGLTMLLLSADAVHGDDQNLCAILNLNGFMNSSIIAGYKTTDAFDGVHECSAGNGASCSACHGNSSPPKNVGNFLCVPNTLPYVITQNCQTLLSAGATNACHGNSGLHFCPAGTSRIAPTCNYRTNDNKNQASWNWTVTFNGASQAYSVDCSTTNYQGYQE